MDLETSGFKFHSFSPHQTSPKEIIQNYFRKKLMNNNNYDILLEFYLDDN